MLYADVVLPLPIDGLFTYSVPEQMQGRVQPYVRVKVPFGITKTHTALVVSTHAEPPAGNFAVKPLISVLDDKPVLLPSQYKLWQWISEYYMSPLGDVMQAALPHGIKNEDDYRPRTEVYVRMADGYGSEAAQHAALDSLRRSPRQQQVLATYLDISHCDATAVTREELINTAHCTATHVKALVDKGVLRIYDVEVGRLNNGQTPQPENIKPLSEAQQQAYDQLPHADDTDHKPTLLHGVTSSGKTELYIHLIQEAIDRGQQVLYLLPEIALTVQITSRLRRVFGNRLGIYHSRYSDEERVEIWQKQLSTSPYDVILGVRSSVFLPYQRLGLIIVDEEHEVSFKQQDPSPRYHARSVALMMAAWTGARILLGTATPSAETYYNALHDKYRLVELKTRYRDLQLPHVQVVNVRDLRRRKMMRGLLSPQLRGAVVEALGRGEQAIIFHNRRGFSPIIECHQCGWSPKCPNCDVSLTYHKTSTALSCHYCGYTYRMPTTCPDCGNTELRDRGAGTEKVEDAVIDELRGEVPLRISRMDLDTTRTKNAYERIISDFSSQKTNLLIGTQMVTKGLDFSGVSVVGILSADTMLNQPDFRAWEHSFTMMTQVAGRAGRSGRRGQVVLQTSRPELPVIRQIVVGDYTTFFRQLMEERREFRYPPFTRLIDIYLKHKDDNLLQTAATELGSRLRQSFAHRVLGPDRPVVARIKLLYIRKIVLKLENSLPIMQMRSIIRRHVAEMMQDARYRSILVSYDVDPL